MQHIFISYRRDDSAYAAGRLYDRLTQHFASDRVFMDINAIELGTDFRDKIEESLSGCTVVIALIGRNWLNAADSEGRRRLEDPDDFVRLELAAAIKRNIHLIPALIDGATMPPDSKLPQELRALVRRNGLEIAHSRFHADVTQLIEGLERILERTSKDNPVDQPNKSPDRHDVNEGKERREQSTPSDRPQRVANLHASQPIPDGEKLNWRRSLTPDERKAQLKSSGIMLLILLATWLACYVVSARDVDDNKPVLFILILFEVLFPIYLYRFIKRRQIIPAILGALGMCAYGIILVIGLTLSS